MDNSSDCVLKFNKYEVNKILFVKNVKFRKEEFNGLDLNIDTNINYPKDAEDNSFTVNLKIEIGKDAENNNYPFNIVVEITGFFELDKSELDKMKQFAEINAVSILFPYARALITTITANANIPPVVLPPMNIAGIMANKNEEADDSEKCDKIEE
jgi:preprotein translocase subunit SecB